MGGICLLSIATWAYYNVKDHKKRILDDVTETADRLSKTIILGTHYAMMLNAREDINQIIQNISRQKEISNIRIYNKKGYIKFSNLLTEVDRVAHLDSDACHICHASEPPLTRLELNQRERMFHSREDGRFLGIITPIYNEPGCSLSCHFHDEDDTVLGALDVVVSLSEADQEILKYQQGIVTMAVAVILVTSLFVFLFVYSLVIRPIGQLIEKTGNLEERDRFKHIQTHPESEIGHLAAAFDTMCSRIDEKQVELNKQKDQYQSLFERVPCLITVQDRNFKLINYNREFQETFHPSPGGYCYEAYKGRKEKCENCPVEKTFADGQSHYSEEKGMGKDGEMEYWIVRTSPIKDEHGEIVAAMEINLDITHRKKLEKKLALSEKKYHAIFDNIPNPIFVLDQETLAIIDCNDSVETVYGYSRREILQMGFTRLFDPGDQKDHKGMLKNAASIHSARHIRANGSFIFVDIWISPAKFSGQEALLVITSDITERLEAEERFNQAAKLATLGEMATGVAHELNQPLSVIKTASSFCLRKLGSKASSKVGPKTGLKVGPKANPKAEKINLDLLSDLLTKIDSNVDRASRIIIHMRDFARKTDVELEKVDPVNVFEHAFEIFSQQLKVRGIEVIWQVTEPVPLILADPGRLEQVFINLLINARDAIEEKLKIPDHEEAQEAQDRRITICIRTRNGQVIIRIGDTGGGVPEMVADKVFQPFFTTKEVGKGTGLGLSISYGIIKECSGDIRLKETSPRGTIFEITIPACENKERICHEPDT